MGEKCDNLIVEITGSTRTNDNVVIGGHYDALQGVPGANDNGKQRSKEIFGGGRKQGNRAGADTDASIAQEPEPALRSAALLYSRP